MKKPERFPQYPNSYPSTVQNAVRYQQHPEWLLEPFAQMPYPAERSAPLHVLVVKLVYTTYQNHLKLVESLAYAAYQSLLT